MSAVAALFLLVALGAPGVAALRRASRWLEPLEQVAYGVPLGVVTGSLVLLLGAIAYGLSAPLVVLVGLLSTAMAVLLWPERPSLVALRAAGATLARRPALDRPRLTRTARDVAAWMSRGSVLVIGLFVLRWAALWHGAITSNAAGLWAGQINIWGDWAQHVGDVSSFAYGDNFPPDHPRYAGTSYAYHYLASLTAAAMVKLGMTPTGALTLHSFLFSVVIALGLYAFARRLTRDAAAAAVTVVLFLLGGSLGWLLTVAEIDRTHQFWSTLVDHPWNGGLQQATGFKWQNIYLSSIEPQRSHLYGVPLSLLVLTLLHVAASMSARRAARDVVTAAVGSLVGRWRRGFAEVSAGIVRTVGGRRATVAEGAVPVLDSAGDHRATWRLFAAAGVVAGLLPYAHLGPLPALAMISVALVALFPTRDWAFFFVPWVVLTVPQLLLQGGEGGTQSEVRRQVGWVASPDPWLWFWLKNLGWFLPLLLIALVSRRVVPAETRRFLWAFMPIFVVANLAVFQPDPWDNMKFLLFWFLGTCVLVAALLTKTWRDTRSAVVRFLIAGAVATMVLSGLLVNLQQARGLDRYLWLTTEEVQLAAEVRAQTPPHAVFAVGLQPNHPIPMLSGRPVVMSYPGWIWPRGIDPGPRERDLRAIYALAPEAPDLLRKYNISYVVIGPWERQNFQANEAAFRDRYPVVIQTATYEVFAVAQE